MWSRITFPRLEPENTKTDLMPDRSGIQSPARHFPLSSNYSESVPLDDERASLQRQAIPLHHLLSRLSGADSIEQSSYEPTVIASAFEWLVQISSFQDLPLDSQIASLGSLSDLIRYPPLSCSERLSHRGGLLRDGGLRWSIAAMLRSWKAASALSVV
jgi:hypothetical protein